MKIRALMRGLVFVCLSTLSLLGFAMSDGGTDAVLEAQNDTAALEVQVADVQAILSDWIYKKGWEEGWNSDGNKMILVSEVSGRIRPRDPDFLDKRAALYLEMELRLKAEIIQSLLSQASASVILDIPGNPLARQFEALTKGYDDALIQAEYGVLDAQDDYEEILAEAGISVADELAGVTNTETFDTKLDDIMRRLDDTYNSRRVSETQKSRVADLKVRLYESQASVERASALRAELESRGNEELEAIRGQFAKSLSTSVETFSQMPLFGAVILKTAEAYDGKRDFRVGGVMAWSPKLHEEATQLMLGAAKGEPRENKESFNDWIRSLDLSKIAGTRRYLAADGSVNFVGIAAVEYDPENVGREAELRAFASQQARGLALLSLQSDAEVSRLAETQSFGVDTASGREDFSFKNMAEQLSASVDLSIQGLVSPAPRRLVHVPSGKDVFVAYAYINSDLASKSSSFRESTYEAARLINLDQSRLRGREAGMRAAVEESKDDAAAFSEGYREGEQAVVGASAESKPTAGGANESGKATVAKTKGAGPKAGTFVDEEDDAEDDF